MPADLFGRTAPVLNGVFAADLAVVTLGNGITTVLMQSLNVTYAQQVTRLYEIGTSFIYYIGGRTNGQMGVGRIIGPNATITQLYAQYGNVCKAAQNSMQITLKGSNCTAGADLSYTMQYCVLTQVGIAVQAQDMIFNENSTLMFSSLVYDPEMLVPLPQP